MANLIAMEGRAGVEPAVSCCACSCVFLQTLSARKVPARSTEPGRAIQLSGQTEGKKVR